MRYFQRRGLQEAGAEDLAQDCFTRLFSLAGRSHIENEEAYLFQIASSVYVDYVRRQRSRFSNKHVSIEGSDFHDLPSDVPGPEIVLEGKEVLARYKSALKELSPRIREIYLLNRLDGLTYTQIAVRFGITKSGVEKFMIKALAHLSKRLKEDVR